MLNECLTLYQVKKKSTVGKINATIKDTVFKRQKWL